MVRSECMATVGAVSNPDQQNIKLGSAGKKAVALEKDHICWCCNEPN